MQALVQRGCFLAPCAPLPVYHRAFHRRQIGLNDVNSSHSGAAAHPGGNEPGPQGGTHPTVAERPAPSSPPAPAETTDSQQPQHTDVEPTPVAATAATTHDEEPTTLLGRVRRFFTGSKLDKQRLAALGFGAFSAYGVISNINAGILITIAWLTVVRTTGLTPLDDGTWPRFAAIYAGLWIGSNFLRPVRLTLALAAAPLFDAAITAVSRRTRLPKVPAFVVMLMCIAVGTTSLLLATIGALGGFPPGCRLPWQAL